MPSDKEIEAAAEAYLVSNPATHSDWSALSDEAKDIYRVITKAALEAAEKVRGDGWLPIETCPGGEDVFLAAYIEPSDTAKVNGAKAFWDVQVGVRFGKTFTRALSGRPTHWQPIKLPLQPQTEDK